MGWADKMDRTDKVILGHHQDDVNVAVLPSFEEELDWRHVC